MIATYSCRAEREKASASSRACPIRRRCSPSRRSSPRLRRGSSVARWGPPPCCTNLNGDRARRRGAGSRCVSPPLAVVYPRAASHPQQPHLLDVCTILYHFVLCVCTTVVHFLCVVCCTKSHKRNENWAPPPRRRPGAKRGIETRAKTRTPSSTSTPHIQLIRSMAGTGSPRLPAG